ncbi:Ig-like domain-containing protein [Desulforhopalus sp. IMCC35007]|uniref:Ig-like domain-containing protein n=1 Tax=Desulforhopalus sp. IMCC35007 TaxID=2569543 RepID=UPI0010AE2490|nr:Ig-like domain-containing protein [Desulforhopalus sp. IMCC35007]TKB07288.1 tandem-95 repeat protein [Desulforhopalus sp. IMCC35007]
MNLTNVIKKSKASLVMAAAFTFISTPLFARVDLVAIEGQWAPVGGTPITMWGFARDVGQACNSSPDWTVGPELTATDLQTNGNLRIRLRNCLSEDVSVIIPGQKAIVVGNAGQHPEPVRSGVRITSFTTPTPAGETVDYLWHNVDQNEGSYLYMSGSHPAKQVHMGLYGALKVGVYANTSGDVTLLYSEIDPALHNPPAPATPLTYKPRYFLVNGVEEANITAGDTTEPVVLSFLNAGLDFHVPALNKGYMTLIAEDGNSYPYAKKQYSANLAAGKTIDAFWQPATAGDHVIYDRQGNNMLARITVGAGSGAPLAAADSYSATEDTELNVPVAAGLMLNDTSLPASAEVELVSGVSAGVLSLNADGSFTYQPSANFSGTDSFTYRVIATASSPASNIATVSITVTGSNDAPTATNDSYEAVAGVQLVVAAPGVLANDQDPDGDSLTVSAGPVNSDGSFTYNPGAPGTESFTYTVNDGNGGTATATVTINITNDVPVAVDDTATVRRNSVAGDVRNTFSLIENDSDANGIDGTTVVVSGTSQGGILTNNGDGTVTYVPVRRWRGTDTFTYTVMDMTGAISNTATVRVNVVRNRDLPPL